MAFRYNNSPDRSEELCSFLFLHLSCHLLRFCRRVRSNIIAAGEAVYDIRDHVEDFGDCILMFDIDELCHAVLDHEDGTGAHLRAHTTAAICLCGLCKGTGCHAAGHVHERDDRRVLIHLHRLAHNKDLNSASTVDGN